MYSPLFVTCATRVLTYAGEHNKLFTHIIATFDQIVMITLQSITLDHPIKRERVVHRYSTYGVIMMLVMELKYKLHSAQDRLDAVALLIVKARSMVIPKLYSTNV